MRTTTLATTTAALLLATGCGGAGDDAEPAPEEPPMKVEDTVFGDLVGTQDKARARTDAALDARRETIQSGIEAAEDAAPPPGE